MLFLDLLNPKPDITELSKIGQRFSKHLCVSELESQYSVFCKDDAVKTLFKSDRCSNDMQGIQGVSQACHSLNNTKSGYLQL
ncbi:UNVERIFIED_CONTAM: hypothetical protein FKN15_064545 [Acipenser sinensis]